jgi:peptidoglycan hydrolase-like protein with peptidoglycan-binding domain
MAHTVAEAQTALKSLGFDPGEIDGAVGPKTAAAVVEFQKSRGLAENGKFDPPTLNALFPSTLVPKAGNGTIQATVMDWVLNYAQSKIVWAAGVLIVGVVGWVNGQFGVEVSPDVQNAVTSLLVAAGGALIAILRGWGKDTPRVASVAPAVVQKPAEWTK